MGQGQGKKVRFHLVSTCCRAAPGISVEVLICISKRVQIFKLVCLLSFEGASLEHFCIFQKPTRLLFTLAAWKLKVKVGFLRELWYSVTCAYLLLAAGLPPNTAASVPEPVTRTELQPWVCLPFYLLTALYRREKEGMRQIIQSLTPTRRGNIPGSLSTNKRALREVLLFIDAPCFPSLYYTYTDLVDSYHQMQCNSLLTHSKGLSLQENTLSICLLSCCLRAGFGSESYLKMGFVWILSFKTPLRGSVLRKVNLEY